MRVCETEESELQSRFTSEDSAAARKASYNMNNSFIGHWRDLRIIDLKNASARWQVSLREEEAGGQKEI